MAKQTINIGSNANDGTGDPLRTAFDKINDNFTELYGSDNDLNTLDANLDVNNYIITTGVTNGNITITPNGTGDLLLGALRVNGTSISADNSSFINLNEGVIIDGSLRVDDAVNLNTSLTLATGATITEFSTSTSLGTSDTKVPTQNAVKAYVDAQNVAQAITFVGDDSTGTAVNSGETFQILGGAGLTSAVTGDAITLDIDATVATLTGGQTLTNKALTSPTISGTPTIIGVTATGATGTGNLVFSAGPTLTGTLAAATITASGTLTVTGNTTINGTLTTTDITTTGNQTITGNITVAGEVRTDKIKSPATNANLEIAAQGTGIVDIQSAMTTDAQTIGGNVIISPGFTLDGFNLNFNSNSITATNTNGGITIAANGSGLVAIGPTLQTPTIAVTTLGATTANVSGVLTVQGTTITDRIETASNADLVLDPQGTGTVDFKVPAQDTVGSAGAASALPANPTGYFKIKVNGYTFVVPYYAQS